MGSEFIPELLYAMNHIKWVSNFLIRRSSLLGEEKVDLVVTLQLCISISSPPSSCAFCKHRYPRLLQKVSSSCDSLFIDYPSPHKFRERICGRPLLLGTRF